MIALLPSGDAYATLGKLHKKLGELQRKQISKDEHAEILKRAMGAYQHGCRISNYEHVECGVNFAHLLYRSIASEKDGEMEVDLRRLSTEEQLGGKISKDRELFQTMLPKLAVALGRQFIVHPDLVHPELRNSLTPRLALATVIELAVLGDNESSMGERAAEELHRMLDPALIKQASVEDSEWLLEETFLATQDLCNARERQAGSDGKPSPRLRWWIEFYAQHVGFEDLQKLLQVEFAGKDDEAKLCLTEKWVQPGRRYDKPGTLRVHVLELLDHMNSDKGFDLLTIRITYINHSVSFTYAGSGTSERECDIRDIHVKGSSAGEAGRALTITVSSGIHGVKNYAIQTTTASECGALINILSRIKALLCDSQHFITKGGEEKAIQRVKNRGNKVDVDIEYDEQLGGYVAKSAGVPHPLILGEGTFGRVFLATNRTNATAIATKILNESAMKRCKNAAFEAAGALEKRCDETEEEFSERRQFHKDKSYFDEMMRLEMLQHRNIVKYLGHHHHDKLYLAIHMEYMGGGSVKTVLLTTRRSSLLALYTVCAYDRPPPPMQDTISLSLCSPSSLLE